MAQPMVADRLPSGTRWLCKAWLSQTGKKMQKKGLFNPTALWVMMMVLHTVYRHTGEFITGL